MRGNPGTAADAVEWSPTERLLHGMRPVAVESPTGSRQRQRAMFDGDRMVFAGRCTVAPGSIVTYAAPWGDTTVHRVDDVADLTLDGNMYFVEANVALVSAPVRTGHRELGPLLARLAGPYGVDAARAWRARTKLGWMRDAFGQPYRGWSSDADAAMWYLLRLLLAGALDVCPLDVDAAPGLDVARIDNQATLDRSLPPWCRAIVDHEQRNADFDGSLRIAPDTPVHGLRINRWPWFGGSVPHHKPLRQLTAPIPLEIGYSNPTRTLVHLCQSTAVARWPRDRPHVVLLSAAPDIVDMTAQLETDLEWDDERGGDLGTQIAEKIGAHLP